MILLASVFFGCGIMGLTYINLRQDENGVLGSVCTNGLFYLLIDNLLGGDTVRLRDDYLEVRLAPDGVCGRCSTVVHIAQTYV